MFVADGGRGRELMCVRVCICVCWVVVELCARP